MYGCPHSWKYLKSRGDWRRGQPSVPELTGSMDGEELEKRLNAVIDAQQQQLHAQQALLNAVRMSRSIS